MNASTQQETSSIQFTDGRVSIYQPENKDLVFPYEKKFTNFAEERQHRKERLVAACRAFALHGLDYGFAGHLTIRDPERPELQGQLHSWTPIPLQRLPFRSVLVASQDDPFCRFERACQFAQAWGSQCTDHGHAGHINADSGLGSWPEGHVLLQDLLSP
mgnify:CR=1 FL=1